MIKVLKKPFLIVYIHYCIHYFQLIINKICKIILLDNIGTLSILSLYNSYLRLSIKNKNVDYFCRNKII